MFSVRPWVFGPSTLAGWKKYNKNKGSLVDVGKGGVIMCYDTRASAWQAG